MKKSRFTESQIVAILKEVESGLKVDPVCRSHGISSATYYNWKSKYGGMEASDVKRLKWAKPKENSASNYKRKLLPQNLEKFLVRVGYTFVGLSISLFIVAGFIVDLK